MEIIRNHRSIRNYSSRKISLDLLNSILECGIRASNTGNMQLYSVIVTQDAEKKDLLAPFHFNQPMVKQAPVVLTICFDFNRFSKWCGMRNASASFFDLLWLLNGAIDVSLLAQNICIAAENEGLGICYLGTTLYNSPEIANVLKLPIGVIPITTLTLGYPASVPELTSRLPLEAIVHFEEYHDYSEDKITEIYQELEELESSKKFISENGKTTLSQVFTEVRYKKEDSVFFSKKIIQMLINQGFCFE